MTTEIEITAEIDPQLIERILFSDAAKRIKEI